MATTLTAAQCRENAAAEAVKAQSMLDDSKNLYEWINTHIRLSQAWSNLALALDSAATTGTAANGVTVGVKL